MTKEIKQKHTTIKKTQRENQEIRERGETEGPTGRTGGHKSRKSRNRKEIKQNSRERTEKIKRSGGREEPKDQMGRPGVLNIKTSRNQWKKHIQIEKSYPADQEKWWTHHLHSCTAPVYYCTICTTGFLLFLFAGWLFSISVWLFFDL